jgi:hypothetical protein
MKIATIKMVLAFTAAGLLSANVALAKNGGGNKGGNKGGFKISFGGGSNHKSCSFWNHNNHKDHHHHNKYHSGYYKYNGGYYSSYPYGQVVAAPIVNVGQAFEPFHSNYVVEPGDSFYEVSLKEYATSGNARFIAQFNGMPQSAALTPGQILQVPSISASGQLSASRAPTADALRARSTGGVANVGAVGNVVSNFNNLGSGISSQPAPVVEAPQPKVTVGSTLLVDGQSFGDKAGTARLRVSGLSLPIEVLERTTGAVKIQLPTVELTSATKADIEVIRADGTLASKSGVELGAATPVALIR